MTKWAAGQSGNPNGRPKRGHALSDLLAKSLQEQESDGRTKAEVIAEKLVEQASKGDIDALKIILDRTEGKVPDTTNLNASGALKIRVVYEGVNAKAASTSRGADDSSD
jgi:hypothetical protein